MKALLIGLLSFTVFLQSGWSRKSCTTIHFQNDSIDSLENNIISLEYRVSFPSFRKPGILSEETSPNSNVTVSRSISSGNTTEIETVKDVNNTVLCKRMHLYYRLFLLYQLIQNLK